MSSQQQIASAGGSITRAVGELILSLRPGIPYAGVAIGDAADCSLLSSIYPDRTGGDQLFSAAATPHLGATVDLNA